jgi:membrane-bound lytic murein transglycosylase D
MRILKASIFVVLSMFISVVYAQGPQVPSVIEFAGMKLKLHNHVRQEIQDEVNALHRSQRYFNIKLDRVNLYFPIIERVLAEEKVPDDFKYLVIQESALISDAVSTSNAVGFWQFKIPSAKEVGLKIDGNVDERLNITASTHGAAKYLKRNNFYFNNWVYALIAYQAGVGGANSIVNDKYFGAKKMDLNRKTYWYVIKFLAHKVAFENYIGQGTNKRLYEYMDGGGQSLKQIASSLGVDYDELRNYNKWLKRGKIPQDKLYWVIIPGLSSPPAQTVKATPQVIKSEDIAFVSPNSDLYPKIKVGSGDSRIVKVNGIPGVIADDGEDLKTLALIGGLELSKFLRVNEMDISHPIVAGSVYYYKSKKGKASEHYHTVLPGEDLWFISQKYGVKIHKLIQKNRLENEEDIKPGLVLWLRYIRSADQPVEYVKIPDPEPAIAASMAVVEPEILQEEVADQVSPEDEDAEIMDDYSQIIEEKESQPDEIITEQVRYEDEAIEEDLTVEELEELDREKVPLFHIVEVGETLYAISRKYDISIDEIYRINELSVEDKIGIGQKIYLNDPFNGMNEPVNENSGSDSYINYTVKKGDTMYSISKQHNASIEDLLEWNNKADYSLKEGEILRIKAQK